MKNRIVENVRSGPYAANQFGPRAARCPLLVDSDLDFCGAANAPMCQTRHFALQKRETAARRLCEN